MRRKRHSGGMSRQLSLFLYHHLQEAKTAIAGIWFAPLTSLMTIAVIAISLAVPSVFYVILKNAESVSQQWQSGTQITLYLKKGTAEAQALALVDNIKQDPEVERVRYISPDEALQEFASLSGFSDAMRSLSENPLPAVIEITPDSHFRTPQATRALSTRYATDAVIEQAKLDLQWLERLQGIINLIRHSVQGMAVLLIFGLVLTIANTLRLNIFSRRAEIEVMKLVGATNRFIYRPYLYLGLWYGLMGGMLAWWLCEVLILWSEHQVTILAALYDSHFRLMGLSAVEGGALLLASMGLGILAAWFSVYRHISEIEPG
ncbi:permease-like cell division protein FtsX [Pseudaeromonas sharmana]|uniref:Cell division protein FtsX n=1 Tax=Pseudaeromonas sharmana TaxID=328412 RepID=A0ABV8CNQ8_9GAMM